MFKKFACVLLLALLFSSCKTVPDELYYFSFDTSYLNVLQSGTITNDTTTYDGIVIDGNIQDSSANLLWNIVSDGHTVRRTWSGNVYDGDNSYAIEITCLTETEDGFKDPEDTSAIRYITLIGIQDIEITGLPKSYEFKKFDPPSGGGSKLWLSDNDLPVSYMDFTIDNKQFTVMLTTMRYIQPVFGEPSTTTIYEDLLLDPEQRFQIIDEKGQVYAQFVASYYEHINWKGNQFREGSYTIFDVDENFNESKLVPAIAIVDILKYLTYLADIR